MYLRQLCITNNQLFCANYIQSSVVLLRAALHTFSVRFYNNILFYIRSCELVKVYVTVNETLRRDFNVKYNVFDIFIASLLYAYNDVMEYFPTGLYSENCNLKCLKVVPRFIFSKNFYFIKYTGNTL